MRLNSGVVLLGFFFAVTGRAGDRNLDALFSPGAVSNVHCDLSPRGSGVLEAVLWKGYAETGFETTRPPVTDLRPWKSLRFEVDNPSTEPLSVFVRLSAQPAHPSAGTYTGGTFDGFVIGPGHSTVEISLEDMLSPEDKPIAADHIAWMGVFFQPLFLRDGQDLKFARDQRLVLSHPSLSERPAKRQKQPYAELLFKETEPGVQALRQATAQALAELERAIQTAKAGGRETAYAEIVPYVSGIVFHSRLVAFWQDREREQREALEFLLAAARSANRVLEGRGRVSVPAVPTYDRLAARDGYFRRGDDPVLLFGMLYNQGGPLLRWFADSETDYGTQLVAGGTRHDVERQPIWEAYHKYPDTHRVGWDHSDHIIRDATSWEVVGPPVNVCLESPNSRAAVAQMIEKFERSHAGDKAHLVQNLGYEYTYVCYCDYTRKLWQDWLKRKYTDISTANRVWGTRFRDFADAPMPRQEEAAANRGLWFDWASFNQYRFIEQIRWTRDQIRRWEPDKPLTVGSPYYAFDPAFWTGVDEEELADSGVTGVVLEENYELDTLMPEYLHALAGTRPVADFEYHGVIHQILPSFLHGDAAISMWWWNDRKGWTPHEPINEWTSSFPQSYTIPVRDIAKTMRDALDVRRLSPELAALGSAERPLALLYSKTTLLQQVPGEAGAAAYISALRRTYNDSQGAGLYLGMTTEKKILAGDLARRKVLVVAGAEFLPDAVVQAILKWVGAGGALIVSPDSMLADEYARPADRPALLGMRLLRRDPPSLQRGEKVVTSYNFSDLPRVKLDTGLEAAGGRHVLDAPEESVHARFPDGSPALLRVRHGQGTVYWLATPLTGSSWQLLLAQVAESRGLKPELQVRAADGQPAGGVEFRVTEIQGRRLAYLYNNSDRDLQLSLKPDFAFREMVDRRSETAISGGRLDLPARETALLEFR